VKWPAPQCDTCGRFFPVLQKGSSWIAVPCSDVSDEDMRDRCAKCTAASGPLVDRRYVAGIAYGMVA